MNEVLVGKELLKKRKQAPMNFPCHLSFVPFTSGKETALSTLGRGFWGEERREGVRQKACCSLHVAKKLSAASIFERIVFLFILYSKKIHRDGFHLKIYSIYCEPEKIDSVLQLKNPASQKSQQAQGRDILCNGNRSLNPLKINTWYKIQLRDKDYSSNILK